MAKKINLPIYRFKGDIMRKLTKSPDINLRISFQDSEGNGFEITDPQQIPTVEILENRFPESDSVKLTAYFNDIPVKDEIIYFGQEPDESTPEKQDKSILSGESAFIREILRQQDILNEMKFKNFVEITEIKINGMKAQFEEMLKSKEDIYREKLELEREKVKLETGIESEGLLYKAISKTLDELSPHIGDLAAVAIEKLSTPKTLTQKRF